MLYVGIFEIGTDKLIDKIEAGKGMRTAERVERGVNINLNHDKYYTEIYHSDDE